MIRIIIILALSYVGLYANYKQAFAFYQNFQYKQAILEAKNSKQDYANPELHLIWGHSARELGLTTEAMHAFERVLILDENNKEAKDALYAIYRQTDREFLIEDSKDKASSSPIKSNLNLALGYDTNINVTAGNTLLNDYFDTLIDEEKISSSFSRMTGKISYKNDIGEKGGWYTKAIVRAYLQSNFSAHYYDLSIASLEWGAGYSNDSYDLFIPLTYYRINYLEKDLLSQYKFSPRVLIPVNKEYILEVNALYSQNRYIPYEDETKDDTTSGAGIGGYYLFNKNLAYFHTKYEHRATRHVTPFKYIGANFLILSTGFNYHLNSPFVAAIDYRFRYGQYNDKVGLSNTRRDDNYHELNMKLSYVLSKHRELSILETYTENRSNYVPSKYRKHTLMFGINFKY